MKVHTSVSDGDISYAMYDDVMYVLGGLGEEERLHAVLEGVVAHVLYSGVPALGPRRVLWEGKVCINKSGSFFIFLSSIKRGESIMHNDT